MGEGVLPSPINFVWGTAGMSGGGESDWTKSRILIFDQDDDFRFWVRSIFNRLQVADILSTATANEAMQGILSGNVTIALLELGSNETAAIEIIRRVRNRYRSPLPDLPLILLTRGQDKMLLAKACAGGVDGVILKPVSERVLLHTVAQALRKLGVVNLRFLHPESQMAANGARATPTAPDQTAQVKGGGALSRAGSSSRSFPSSQTSASPARPHHSKTVLEPRGLPPAPTRRSSPFEAPEAVPPIRQKAPQSLKPPQAERHLPMPEAKTKGTPQAAAERDETAESIQTFSSPSPAIEAILKAHERWLVTRRR
ncbi:MAG: Low-complexity protein [Rhodospirillaceae bacterium]|nr:MAG: Low-complexity protein [Rhodospirillaceae bacterium]